MIVLMYVLTFNKFVTVALLGFSSVFPLLTLIFDTDPFVLKRDVKLQPTNQLSLCTPKQKYNQVISSLVNFLRKHNEKIFRTRMWANAQPDGRPVEHRWRPLFNATKFG